MQKMMSFTLLLALQITNAAEFQSLALEPDAISLPMIEDDSSEDGFRTPPPHGDLTESPDDRYKPFFDPTEDAFEELQRCPIPYIEVPESQHTRDMVAKARKLMCYGKDTGQLRPFHKEVEQQMLALLALQLEQLQNQSPVDAEGHINPYLTVLNHHFVTNLLAIQKNKLIPSYNIAPDRHW